MIKDKVVIITGASSGIGKATALRLSKAGAQVVLGARNEQKLQEITDKIKKNGGKAVYLVTDVTSRDDNKALIDLAIKKFGKVDTIFLNAGVMPNSLFKELRVDDWDKIIDVNIKGVLYGIAATLPEFEKQGYGQIIATSSVAGIRSYTGCGVYGASKWAVKEIMEVLRKENAQDKSNIRTTTIYPAAIHSNLINGIPNKDIQKGEEFVRTQTELPADEVAKAVEYIIDAPEETDIHELTIGPLNQPW